MRLVIATAGGARRAAVLQARCSWLFVLGSSADPRQQVGERPVAAVAADDRHARADPRSSKEVVHVPVREGDAALRPVLPAAALPWISMSPPIRARGGSRRAAARPRSAPGPRRSGSRGAARGGSGSARGPSSSPRGYRPSGSAWSPWRRFTPSAFEPISAS